MSLVKETTKQLLHQSKFLAYKLRRRGEVALRRFVPPAASRPLPTNPGGRVLLHLGCGTIDAPGFINIDAQAAPHVHYELDVRDLSPFADQSVDLVYSCHVLEHYPAHEHPEILWEWSRVLKPGGVLRISVPGFEELLHVYEEQGRDVSTIVGPLMGYDDGYNAHCHIFNLAYFEQVLTQAGLRDVRRWDPDVVDNHDFEDWASRKVTRGDKKYRISINVEADKA